MDGLTPKKRNLQLDLARALCVLWIVGFWHLINYLPSEYKLEGNNLVVCKEITYGVLACFTFLSGFFLKKYDFNNINDVIIFYKKRLTRFYPLFVVASFCLFVCGSSINQVLFAIIGLSMFVPTPIPTLWYFSMLLLFYLFTPLLKMKGRSVKIKVLISFFIFLLFVIGYLFADQRFIMYLPFYILGLNLSNSYVERLNHYTFILSVALFVAFCYIGSDNLAMQIIQAAVGVIVILSFCNISYNDKMRVPVTFVAESSMCAYLFHRPVYTVFTFLLGKSKPFHYMPIHIAIVAIIALFVVSYFIQRYYNIIINKITLKNGK